MHFAISILQAAADGTFEPAPLRAYLSRAQSLGFHSAWTQEAVLSAATSGAALELMAFAACAGYLDYLFENWRAFLPKQVR
jgi:hypothetical protein